MSINVHVVKINTPNSAKNTDICSENNLSFGTQFKTYTIGKNLQNTIEWFGKRSTPFNRFMLGATAVVLQPFIDLNNKDVDEKTRRISWARAIAKAIAGTCTGILIRYSCIKSINALTRTPKEIEEMVNKGKKVSNWSTALVPNKIKNDITKKIDKAFSHEEYGKTLRLVKKHRETIGSCVALGVMLFTNFALDVPITKFLTNKIAYKYVNNESTKNKGGNK